MSMAVLNTSIAFSTKANGSMKKSDGTLDLKNIKRFLTNKSLPENVVCMEQVHGGKVAIVKSSEQNIIEGVDGLVTQKTNLSLGVVSADCLPILFYDPQKNICGVAHAGSKGLLREIINHVVEAFITTFQSNPKDIIVTIGPSIEKKCYEVGQELIEQFEKQFEWFDESFFSSSKRNHYLLDLRNIALQCLLKEGILKEHIEISDLCTKCEFNTCYSYRRGDVNGRFVSVISLQ